ncbi:MAG: hypothetical protein KIS94_11290 [Chitinophagales bacterium]|nr:hypothetical protein [Chitinophagales bacterium]
MKFTSLLFALGFSVFLSAQTADDIINKHIAATGGAEKWGKVHSLKCLGHYVMGPGMLPPVSEIKLTKPFSGYYSDFSWQGMTNKQAMRADSGWTYNPFSGKRETDPMSAQDIRSTKLEADPQGLLFNYKQKGYTVEYLGTDDMDGTDVFKLRLTTKEGDMVYYFLDAETYNILKTVRRMKLKDKETKSSTVYSDFRQTDYGVILPFSAQGVDEKGQEQGGPINYTKVEVNGNIDLTLFDKP